MRRRSRWCIIQGTSARVPELRRAYPGREIGQTLCKPIGEDRRGHRREAGAVKNLAELYRDEIHMTNDHGKYLMHNAMRHALGQPPSAAGFDKLNPEGRRSGWRPAKPPATAPADKTLLARILAMDGSVDCAALIAKLADKDLQSKMTALLPEIERAVKVRCGTLALEAEIKEIGGKLICTPSGSAVAVSWRPATRRWRSSTSRPRSTFTTAITP